jgi:hypothetical protein
LSILTNKLTNHVSRVHAPGKGKKGKKKERKKERELRGVIILSSKDPSVRQAGT